MNKILAIRGELHNFQVDSDTSHFGKGFADKSDEEQSRQQSFISLPISVAKDISPNKTIQQTCRSEWTRYWRTPCHSTFEH